MDAMPAVMVLGVFHFRYLEDVMHPRRQKEIEELVEHIKKFQPTKVVVEVVAEQNEDLNREYQKFVGNGWTGDDKCLLDSPGNEVYQLGFRVARDLGHKSIYAIDWMTVEQDDKEFMEQGFARAEKIQAEILEEQKKWVQQASEILSDGTVTDAIRSHNNEEYEFLTHQTNIRHTALLGEHPAYVGTHWLRWWYQRNLIVYSNVVRLATENTDRVLVIFGSAHNYLLKQFFRDSGLFEVELVQKYL
ncbi:DUF5694 domain-containing protein [Alicyclobacillus fodiniaquatilis]|uniref:DUF5694 domain-containing protein n=1 Tax=Alicyclobacillus fodiniaquatilis TaxID=1661150 RepID=A0ABW4JJ04_9BACL